MNWNICSYNVEKLFITIFLLICLFITTQSAERVFIGYLLNLEISA